MALPLMYAGNTERGFSLFSVLREIHMCIYILLLKLCSFFYEPTAATNAVIIFIFTKNCLMLALLQFITCKDNFFQYKNWF